MRKERIDIRLEPELLEELEIIAERTGLRRSELIRDALANFVESNKGGWNSRNVQISIPTRLADRVDWAIMNGDAGTVDSVVEKSLEYWLDYKEKWHRDIKPELDRMARENARNDEAKAQLEVNARKIARK